MTVAELTYNYNVLFTSWLNGVWLEAIVLCVLCGSPYSCWSLCMHMHGFMFWNRTGLGKIKVTSTLSVMQQGSSWEYDVSRFLILCLQTRVHNVLLLQVIEVSCRLTQIDIHVATMSCTCHTRASAHVRTSPAEFWHPASHILQVCLPMHHTHAKLLPFCKIWQRLVDRFDDAPQLQGC